MGHKLIFFIIANLTALQAYAASTQSVNHKDDQKVHQAIDLTSQNLLNDSQRILQSVNVETSAFRSAYLEVQKIHYRREAWDYFFGYATFYRKNLMQAFFLPELLTLEALALTKHCQFDAASRAIFLGQEISKELRKGESSSYSAISALFRRETRRSGGVLNFTSSLDRFDTQLKSVENLLILQSKVPGKINSNQVTSNIKAFSKDLFWNIDQPTARSQILEKAVRSPQNIRVYVPNLCKEGGAT